MYVIYLLVKSLWLNLFLHCLRVAHNPVQSLEFDSIGFVFICSIALMDQEAPFTDFFWLKYANFLGSGVIGTQLIYNRYWKLHNKKKKSTKWCFVFNKKKIQTKIIIYSINSLFTWRHRYLYFIRSWLNFLSLI